MLEETDDKTARAFADAQLVMDQLQLAMADAQNISSTLAGGVKDALKAAVTGGDIKAGFRWYVQQLGRHLPGAGVPSYRRLPYSVSVQPDWRLGSSSRQRRHKCCWLGKGCKRRRC